MPGSHVTDVVVLGRTPWINNLGSPLIVQVDQGVVLLGVHHMKGGVTRGLVTKDVRSASGWQIGMDVFEQYVQVWSQDHGRVMASFIMLSYLPCCHSCALLLKYMDQFWQKRPCIRCSSIQLSLLDPSTVPK